MLFAGVPDGNRTHVTAATERRSTIELRAPCKNKTRLHSEQSLIFISAVSDVDNIANSYKGVNNQIAPQ